MILVDFEKTFICMRNVNKKNSRVQILYNSEYIILYEEYEVYQVHKCTFAVFDMHVDVLKGIESKFVSFKY